ncbi:GntR family transcriptional regulator [Bifidobacterium simiarum]|uniref:GntR family transcriptional regulator n=1 Tax=Bifidobacterium simiarum TaxID=2045441 RepID=A0A2M9HGG9_9BIFI|nr:winged helix-turn-helix domain-containing protein [Bifidobacterium simiarum]PJM75906.1 GntR family transcriptional regulator [Bifidobacterium simiarum]
MTFSIDHASPIPAFDQISMQIDGLIRSGLLEPGTELPSIRRLSQDLNVSTGTVRHAYAELESRGLIITSPGRAARVAPKSKMSCDVLAAIQCLVEAARKKNVDLNATQSVLTTMWSMR